MCSKVLNGHIILTDTSITTILAPEMTYTPNLFDSFQKDLDFGQNKDAAYIYGPAVPRTYFIGAKFAL